MTIEQLLSSDQYPKKVILEKLLCNKLSITKEELFLRSEMEVSDDDHGWIRDAYHQYTVEKKPLEYILGYVEFAGIRFMVTPDTLIPRPETEYMIEAVNEYIQSGDQQFKVLDIGTGCGVLGLSVLYHNPKHISKILLSELVPETLDVARTNASRLFADSADIFGRISLVQSNLLDHPEIHSILNIGGQAELSPPDKGDAEGRGFATDRPNEISTVLVANLPYIPEGLFDENTDIGIKKREPKMAFVGGDDGLDLYRVMFDQLLALGGSVRPTMFLEIMTRQCDILRQEYDGVFEFEEVKTFHFNIRILKVKINGNIS